MVQAALDHAIAQISRQGQQSAVAQTPAHNQTRRHGQFEFRTSAFPRQARYNMPMPQRQQTPVIIQPDLVLRLIQAIPIQLAA